MKFHSIEIKTKIRMTLHPVEARNISLIVITKNVSRHIAKYPPGAKSSPVENHCSRSCSKCNKIRKKSTMQIIVISNIVLEVLVNAIRI